VAGAANIGVGDVVPVKNGLDRVDWHGGDSRHDGGGVATNLQLDTCERDVARGALRRSHLCRQHAGQRRASTGAQAPA